MNPYNRRVLVSEFDYHLPGELIAQEPLADRAASRMLHVNRRTGELKDYTFRDLPEMLRKDDLLVLNNTRVFPARLYGRRKGVHAQPVSPRNPAARDFLRGRVEVLLTKQLSANPQTWEVLVRPGRKIGIGERLYFGDRDELCAEVVSRGTFGERTVRFDAVADFFGSVGRVGHVPLPPYIDRDDRNEDRERYQTVYAQQAGSVAAPTAGLHFTPEVLERIRARGVQIAEVTLHVGLGTFQPVRVDRVEDVKLHSERYEISERAADLIRKALEGGRRIVAVGTTTVRTLEFAFSHGGIREQSGEADIFISPGFQFRVVGAMLTNFHLPQSTLLMLVSAFAGVDVTRRAYEHAVREGYRFYSYGDCMFVE
jgi:S-adenosylmethionine:tRNA ribosyltransferase-isomerase